MGWIKTLNHYKGDFLWNTTQVAQLTTIELGLGITAACAATFRPLIQKYIGSGRTTKSGGYSGQPVSAHTMRLRSFKDEQEHSDTTPIVGGIQKTTTYITTVSRGEGYGKMPEIELTDSSEAADKSRSRNFPNDSPV